MVVQVFHFYLSVIFQIISFVNIGSLKQELLYQFVQDSILSPVFFNAYLKTLGKII